MLLGLIQCKIQRGVGSGNIIIEKINPKKSIILCSSIRHGDGTATTYNATIVNETTINCGVAMAWTVIEFGGAVE